MNEHTSRPESGGDVFTVRALRDYFTLWLTNLEKFYEERDKRYGEKFAAQDDKTSLALTGSEKAISKAEVATEKRFDAVNEFRGTLSDQAATLLPRSEADARFRNLEEKIEDLRLSRSELSGGVQKGREDRAQSNWTYSQVVTLLVAMMAVAGVIVDAFTRKP